MLAVRLIGFGAERGNKRRVSMGGRVIFVGPWSIGLHQFQAFRLLASSCKKCANRKSAMLWQENEFKDGVGTAVAKGEMGASGCAEVHPSHGEGRKPWPCGATLERKAACLVTVPTLHVWQAADSRRGSST
jgi:hypothetical protein